MIWHARIAGGAGSPPHQKQKRPIWCESPSVISCQQTGQYSSMLAQFRRCLCQYCGLSLGDSQQYSLHSCKKGQLWAGSTSRLFYASANRTIPQKHARTSGSLAYFSLLFLFLVPFCFFRHGGISLYRLVGLPHGRALFILGRVHVLFKSIRMVTFIEGRSAGEVHVRGSNNFAYNQFAEVEIVRFTWHNKFRYGFFFGCQNISTYKQQL